MTVKAARRIQPMVPKAIQRDAFYSALAEQELASQTLGMALWCCGTTHCVAFPSPDSAPFAELTASNTWTDFVVGTEATEQHVDNFHVPWMHQQSQHSIIVEVRVVTLSWFPIKLRAYCDELPGLAALATTTGTESPVVHATEPTTQDAWQRLTNGERGANGIVLTSQIESPTVPSNRLCGIFPQLYTVGENNSAHEISGSWPFYIESMRVLDIPDQRTYGNG